MTEIRATYTGLISFASGISSLIVGTIFMLLLTRTLSVEEFGTWNLILGMIVYGTIIEPIISFWVTRETARNIESAKTAIFAAGVFSIGGSIIYLFMAFFVGSQSYVEQPLLLFGVILIPFMFFKFILNAINYGWKPQAINFALLFSEILKIPAGLILIYIFDMGVNGVILTIMLSNTLSIIILASYARSKIKNKLNFRFIKKWIKFSWISMFEPLVLLIKQSDIVIFSLLTQSVFGLAFLAAANTIAVITVFAGLITIAAYPKLLQGNKEKHMQENFTRLFYFAIPLAAISITFSKPALFTLNPSYEIAFPIVVSMTIQMFFYNLNVTYRDYLKGDEKVDANITGTFREHMKSKLFLLPSIRFIQYSIYLSLLISGLLFWPFNNDPVNQVLFLSLILLSTEIPVFLYLHRLTKRTLDIKLELQTISKYLLSSVLIFGLVYFLMDKYFEYDDNIFELAPKLLLFIFLSIIGYLGLTYVIDLKTKNLLNSIFYTIKNKEY